MACPGGVCGRKTSAPGVNQVPINPSIYAANQPNAGEPQPAAPVAAGPQPGGHEWMMANNPYYRAWEERTSQLPKTPPPPSTYAEKGPMRITDKGEEPLTEARFKRLKESFPVGSDSRRHLEEIEKNYQFREPGMFSGLESMLSSSPAQSRARSGEDVTRFPIYTPEQERTMDQLLKQGGGLAQSLYGGNELSFEPQAELARKGFEQRTIPTIMERFTGVTGGGQRSSALPQQLSQAGQDFESQLAALRSKYGLQSAAVKQGGVGQLLGAGLQPRFETAFTPKSPGFGASFGQGLGQAVGTAAPLLLKSLFI